MYSHIDVLDFLGDQPYVLVRYKEKNKMKTLCKGIFNFKKNTFYASSFQHTEKNVALLKEILREKDWHERIKWTNKVFRRDKHMTYNPL